MRWSTEGRPEKLWVPQETTAEVETAVYQNYYAATSRFNQVLIRSSSDNGNVLTSTTMA